MKKISVMLLAAMMLFAFVACDNNPNAETAKPVFSNDFSGTAEELKAVFGDKANISQGGAATNGGAYLKLADNIDLAKGYNITYTFDLADTRTKLVGFNTSAHYDGTYINAFVEFSEEDKASLRASTEGNLTQASGLKDMAINDTKDITVSIDVKKNESGNVVMTGTVSNGETSNSIGTITCSTELKETEDLTWTIYYGEGTEGDGNTTILTMKDLTITPLA